MTRKRKYPHNEQELIFTKSLLWDIWLNIHSNPTREETICDRETLRWFQMITNWYLPLRNPVPWVWLDSNQQNVSKVMGCHFVINLHKIVTSVLLVDSLYCLLGLHSLMKQAAILEFISQGMEGSVWSKLARNGGLQSNSSWRIEFHQQPHELGNRSFPSQALDEIPWFWPCKSPCFLYRYVLL